MSQPSQPRLIEINCTCSAGGKVQILDYGKITSDYQMSMSRRFEIPEDWTEEQAKEFQRAKYAELREEVDTLADHEFNVRWDQSYLSS